MGEGTRRRTSGRNRGRGEPPDGTHSGPSGVGGIASLPALYAWQHEALSAWHEQGRCGIVEAVTGTGKTVLGLAAVGEALGDRRQAAILVPSIELQQQWIRSLRASLPRSVRLGLLGGGSSTTLAGADVVVAVVNSARHGKLEPSHGALLVADECHRYATELNRTAFAAAFERRLGLTATLERPDRLEQHLHKYLGPTCFSIGYAQAIADEVTAHFTVALIGAEMNRAEENEYDALSRSIAEVIGTLVHEHHFPSHPFFVFMQKVKEAAEDQKHPAHLPAVALLRCLSSRRQLLAASPTKIDLVAGLKPAIAAADRTLVFTDSIDAAEIVGDKLRTVGVDAEALHSEMGRTERGGLLSGFGRGSPRVLVAPRVLDEGIDVPSADLAIVVAGSKTRRQMVQRLGRVLRRKPDGRLARLAVLYLRSTVEDPRRGAHEVFLGEALAVADEYKLFAAEDVSDAVSFLSELEIPRSVPQPRRPGEPRRTIVEPERDDDRSVEEVLGTRSFGGRKPSRTNRQVVRPVSPQAVEGVRELFRRSHAFVTVSERRDFERALPRLLDRFGVEAVEAGVRRSPSLRTIEETAGQVLRRTNEIAAAARRSRAKELRQGRRGSGSARVSSTQSRRRTPRRVPPPDRPRYSGATPPRLCGACGAPETRCGC